jgi:hypothetical protein
MTVRSFLPAVAAKVSDGRITAVMLDGRELSIPLAWSRRLSEPGTPDVEFGTLAASFGPRPKEQTLGFCLLAHDLGATTFPPQPVRSLRSRETSGLAVHSRDRIR